MFGNSAPMNRAQRRAQVRRPAAEQLKSSCLDMITMSTMTDAMLQSMVEDISPDTLRNLSQIEVLERALMAYIANRCD